MAVAGYNSQILVASGASIALTNEGMTDSGDHTTYTITDQSKRYLDKSVAVVVEISTDNGTTWTPAAAGTYTLRFVGARVTFTAAQAANTMLRLASGSYIVAATLATASSADFAGKVAMIDTTNFNTAGTESYTPGLLGGTFKVSEFWIDTSILVYLTGRALLICSFVLPSGNRYEGYMYLSDTEIKMTPKDAVTEDMTFQVSDAFFSA